MRTTSTSSWIPGPWTPEEESRWTLDRYTSRILRGRYSDGQMQINTNAFEFPLFLLHAEPLQVVTFSYTKLYYIYKTTKMQRIKFVKGNVIEFENVAFQNSLIELKNSLYFICSWIVYKTLIRNVWKSKSIGS